MKTDIDMILMLINLRLPYKIVLTKSDKVSRTDIPLQLVMAAEIGDRLFQDLPDIEKDLEYEFATDVNPEVILLK